MADLLAPPSPTPTQAPMGPMLAPAYQAHEDIKALVRKRLAEWSKGRETVLRAAWRNILFYRGHQWIIFDRMQNRFRPSVLKRQTPTPVTNLFASTMDAVMSVLARVEPTLNFRPATDEPEDRATADVSIRAIQVVEDEVNLRTIRQHLATYVGLTAEAWIETGYDPDPIHGMTLLQHQECLTCGTVAPPTDQCAGCGGGLMMPAQDAQGQAVGHQVPVGRMYVDVVSIFEMYYDAAITDWKKQRAYCRKKSVALDDAKRQWPQIADRITADSLGTGSMGDLYADALPTVGPNIDDTKGGMSRTGSFAPWGTAQSGPNRVSEEWYYSLPDETYPEGLCAVIVSGIVAKAGPLPYSALGEQGQRKPFLPHVYFPQKLVPGSGHAKTVADDLALKAAQRNRIESLIESIMMRMANPIWLVPEGANVVGLTGEPGQTVKYNALGPSPAKPERIPGQGIPSGLMAFLELIDKSMEDIAATFDVIKGSKPAGVSAGIALQLLQERGMSRFGSMFILWEAAWAEWARQALEIFREFATEPRLLRLQGRDGRWQVEKFLGADLQGRVDVIPEASSSMPRSSLLDRAEMEQLAALGVINVADPEVRFKFLEVYGRTNLTPAMAADTKNAIMEDEKFAQLAQDQQLMSLGPQELQALLTMPPEMAVAQLQAIGIKVPRVRPAVDDHAVHSREHGNTLKGEAAQDLPLVVQTLWEMHKAEHDRYAMQAMLAMTAGRAGTNPTSGFLSNPGGMSGGQGSGPNPVNGASGPAGMDGQMHEMQQNQAGGM